MARRTSAGLLLYRYRDGLEVFLVHPGGPWWAKKDAGVWSLPKGEFDAPEDPFEAAKRELLEETGIAIDGEFRALGPLAQKSGKVIHAWAIEADCDASAIRSNTFSMEWPPRSGQRCEFPEVDRAGWFGIGQARRLISAGQVGFLDELAAALAQTPGT